MLGGERRRRHGSKASGVGGQRWGSGGAGHLLDVLQLAFRVTQDGGRGACGACIRSVFFGANRAAGPLFTRLPASERTIHGAGPLTHIRWKDGVSTAACQTSRAATEIIPGGEEGAREGIGRPEVVWKERDSPVFNSTG